MTVELNVADTVNSLRLRLEDDGFAVVDDMSNPDDLAFIRSTIRRLIASNSVPIGELGERGGAPQIMEIRNAFQAAPELKSSRYFQAAQELSSRLLGTAARLHFDHVIIKPANGSRETAWHQDCAYYNWRLTVSRRRVHWWLPLHDVAGESGCMVFARGSHRLGRVLHRPVGPTSDALKATLPADAEPVACPLKAGAATVHLPRTLHYTGPNLTDVPREAVILQFAVKTILPELDEGPWEPYWRRETGASARPRANSPARGR
jgi:ectoine hydroxylase-related dioxygenase (phytanoyl-CoA dioxygenase family)